MEYNKFKKKVSEKEEKIKDFFLKAIVEKNIIIEKYAKKNKDI
jgi:hypothetical protein